MRKSIFIMALILSITLLFVACDKTATGPSGGDSEEAELTAEFINNSVISVHSDKEVDSFKFTINTEEGIQEWSREATDGHNAELDLSTFAENHTGVYEVIIQAYVLQDGNLEAAYDEDLVITITLEEAELTAEFLNGVIEVHSDKTVDSVQFTIDTEEGTEEWSRQANDGHNAQLDLSNFMEDHFGDYTVRIQAYKNGSPAYEEDLLITISLEEAELTAEFNSNIISIHSDEEVDSFEVSINTDIEEFPNDDDGEWNRQANDGHNAQLDLSNFMTDHFGDYTVRIQAYKNGSPAYSEDTVLNITLESAVVQGEGMHVGFVDGEIQIYSSLEADAFDLVIGFYGGTYIGGIDEDEGFNGGHSVTFTLDYYANNYGMPTSGYFEIVIMACNYVDGDPYSEEDLYDEDLVFYLRQ